MSFNLSPVALQTYNSHLLNPSNPGYYNGFAFKIVSWSKFKMKEAKCTLNIQSLMILLFWNRKINGDFLGEPELAFTLTGWLINPKEAFFFLSVFLFFQYRMKKLLFHTISTSSGAQLWRLGWLCSCWCWDYFSGSCNWVYNVVLDSKFYNL